MRVVYSLPLIAVMLLICLPLYAQTYAHIIDPKTSTYKMLILQPERTDGTPITIDDYDHVVAYRYDCLTETPVIKNGKNVEIPMTVVFPDGKDVNLPLTLVWTDEYRESCFKMRAYDKHLRESALSDLFRAAHYGAPNTVVCQ